MQTDTTTANRTTDPIRLIAHVFTAMACFVAGLAAAIIIMSDPTAAATATIAAVEQSETTTDGQAHRATSHRRVHPLRAVGADLSETIQRIAAEAPRPTTPKPATDLLSTGPQCPGTGALPEGASHHSLAAADVDGDGDLDTLHGYVLDGQGYVQVSFTGGGGSMLAVDPGFAPMVAPRPGEGHDLDLDGREEFTARIAGGIGGVTHGLFQVDGCTLTAITLDGEAVELHQRETIGNRSGFMCTHEEGNSFLHVWSLALLAPEDLDEPQDGDVYAGPRSMYRLIDGELVLQGVSEAFEIPGEYELDQFSTCAALHP